MVLRRSRSVRITIHEKPDLVADRQADAHRLRHSRIAELGCPLLQASRLVPTRQPCGLPDETGSHEEVRGYGLPCLHFFPEIAAPRRKVIDPADHRVPIATEQCRGKRGAPMVVAERLHRRLTPCGHLVMAIAE